MTYDDLLRAKEAQINGSSPIVATQNGADGRPGFVRAKLANWTAVLDANGELVISPTYVQGGGSQTSNLSATDTQGRTRVDVLINGVKQNQQYYQDAKGNLFTQDGKKASVPKEATIQKSYLTTEEALTQQGFGIKDGLVDIPNNLNVPLELANAKNVKYWTDNNGRVQFAFEQKDAEGNTFRDAYTYDPQTGRYEKASLAAPIAAQDRQMFKENYGGRTQQSDIVGNSIQAPTMSQQSLQKISQEQIQATQKQQVQQAASAQQLNQLPNQPLQVAPIPQPAQPLQVVNVPQPTKPLQVVNTPSSANVKVINTPITQGLLPTVKVVDTPQTGTLRVQ